MRGNYHTHTYRCGHAQGSEEDFVIEAINKNISVLGFSDHGPFYDNRYGLRMDFSELEDYIKTIDNLKIKYKDKITIKCGVEIEYDPREHKFYNELLDEYKLDYMLLGQHYFMSNNGEMKNIYEIKHTSEYISYANSIINAMDSGFFKIIGHPDIFFVNDFLWDDNCEEACKIIINGAKERDFILEFNANGLRKGKSLFKDGERYSYPHHKFFELVKESKVKVIINSDCHNPVQLWDEYMDKAYELCNELNIVDKIF